jgi:hypothetical protein
MSFPKRGYFKYKAPSCLKREQPKYGRCSAVLKYTIAVRLVVWKQKENWLDM